MTENHKQPDLGAQDHNSSGVLFLKNPGETNKSSEWYSSKIAGVPFILRNLLTLQRAGIKTMAVFMEDPHGYLEKSFDKLLKDSRLPKNIPWINNIPKLKEWIQNNPTYIFNGSALHDKKELHSLIHSHSKNEGASAFPINLKKLDELLISNPATIQSQQAGFPLYVPGSKEAEIQNPEDFKRLHEAQVGSSGLSHDSPITRILSRPASRFLTRIFLNTPITPNQITLFSFFVGLMSAFLFFKGGYELCVIASILLVFSTWIDGADGEIARLKFMETDIGKKLDIYCDNIIHFLVFTAIGCGIYFKTGEVIFLYLGGLAGLGGLLSFFLLSPILLDKRSPGKQLFHISEPELAEKFANRDFIHFLLLVALVDQLEIFIAIAAVGANLFAGYLIYSRTLKLKTT
ncbi:MAG: CDP-alcohol phosphatidyltransferase family protein [Nitrospinae bacterium]|nr:CDP-alcohol phosphatidyltransferase family protein [Nitrospinota bacterium]